MQSVSQFFQNLKMKTSSFFFLLIARIRGEIQLYEIEVVDFTAEGGGKVVGRWRRRRLEKMVTEEIEEELVAEGDDGNWGKAECK